MRTRGQRGMKLKKTTTSVDEDHVHLPSVATENIQRHAYNVGKPAKGAISRHQGQGGEHASLVERPRFGAL